MRGGSSKWTFTTGLYVDSSPAISGDGLTVFVGSNDSLGRESHHSVFT